MPNMIKFPSNYYLCSYILLRENMYLKELETFRDCSETMSHRDAHIFEFHGYIHFLIKN